MLLREPNKIMKNKKKKIKKASSVKNIVFLQLEL